MTSDEMMHAGFLLLVLLTEGVLCEVCSYQDVVDHLNLTADNDLFKLTRPVLDHTHSTVVKLDILLLAILAVVEKTQTFVPFIWTTMKWNNERISWDPAQFCGITQISLPEEILWKPDVLILEMIEKNDSPHNPFLMVSYDGTVSYEEGMRVVSTCKMDVHKFPFDTQECTMTVGSAIHCINEMRLVPFSNSSRATQFSREVMQTQGEWDFLELSINNTNLTFNEKTWELVKYTITIKRRPLLHIINFLLPVLFFLILDLTTFFISNHRGEKLSFKVTVLLAISVLLLILNDILPSMSNKTPLIASYCIVIFALMLLNLLETILVTYLMDKVSREDFELQENDQDKHQPDNCHIEDEKHIGFSCMFCRVSEGEKREELLTVAEEVNNSIQLDESHVLLLILDELKKLQKKVYLHFSCKEEKVKFVYWAKRINKVFYVCYIITVLIFLFFIFMEWNS